jgi:hypothetical protein
MWLGEKDFKREKIWRGKRERGGCYQVHDGGVDQVSHVQDKDCKVGRFTTQRERERVDGVEEG